MVRGVAKLMCIGEPSRLPQTLDSILYLGKQIYAETKNPVDINCNNIDMLLGRKLNTNILRRAYDPKRKELLHKYGIKVPLIACLRADILDKPIEEHPLIEAAAVYSNYRPGVMDWQRFVTIPSKIDVKEAELLGLILADRVPVKQFRIDGDGYLYSHNTIYLHGRCKHKELYEEIVSPRISNIFNLPAPVDYANSHLNSKMYAAPTICITSRAVRTWLDDELGFPNLLKIIDHLPELRQKLGFLEGYIAGKAIIQRCNKTSNGVELRLYEFDESTASSLAELVSSLGIKAHGPYKDISCLKGNEYVRYIVGIGKTNVNKLHLLNPLHRKDFGCAC